ncbi:hypothetical protein BKI52_34515 [marine bacterium AO1-C]|nr:hypothetical protein BKI52_34515 [marine bacterium AO1-C]
MRIIQALFGIWLLLGAFQTYAQLIISKNNQRFQWSPQQGFKPLNHQRMTRNFATWQHFPLDEMTKDPRKVAVGLTASLGFDFGTALKNPHDANQWVYIEIQQLGPAFKLVLFNKKANHKKELLYSTNQDRKTMAFKPVGWSTQKNILYLEGFYLDNADEHEGIWSLNLTTNQWKKLPMNRKYMKTPLLSQDRQKLIFTGSLDEHFDILHGHTDMVFTYDLNTQVYQTLVQDKGTMLTVNGWQTQVQNVPQNTAHSNQRVNAVDYYLPWDAGTSLCVSRHGTPGPSGSHTHEGRCFAFTGIQQHSYPAVDFATSLSSDQNVRAAASGTVVFSGISGSLTSGYGRLVIIRHSDGKHTYYAHNKVNLVSTGQTVSRGQVVALEGTTGGSSGDHIHFEWRGPDRGASIPGSFAGIGQPRQDYRYRSNNGTTPPPPPSGDTQAPTTSISAVGGNTQAGDFTVNFTDNDNVAVTRTYYQVLEKYGSQWLANRNRGFFNDNFGVLNTFYNQGNGTWSINQAHLRQSNTSSDNTQLSTYLAQNSGLPQLYEFSAKVFSTSGPRKFGLHIMSDNGNQAQRGNSYLIWFSVEDNKVRIYETINNVLNFRAIADAPLDNNWASYKITYSPGFGVLEIFRNNKSLLKWTDSSPIKSGNAISLRTNQTIVEFDDLKVYKYRTNSSVVITAGSASNDDLRRRDGKIKSMVRDAAGNWSIPGNLDVTYTGASSRVTAQIGESLKVFPNPIIGEANLSIEQAKAGNVQISLYTLQGKQVKTLSPQYLHKGYHLLQINSLLQGVNSGSYLLQIVSKDQKRMVRVVKK